MKDRDATHDTFIKSYDEFADAIFRFCYFKVSNRELAKDLTQETFTRVWEYLRSGKEIDNLKSFLYKVANHLIIDEYRKKKSISLDTLREDGFDVKAPDDNTMIGMEMDIVVDYIGKLEDSYREVVVMRYIHDLSPKEIAEILGENENTVSVRLNRAIKKLQKLLGISEER